ncbi:type II toxin-antitoxin system HigB family toxin [Panacibacter sp. KCS-6]|uniref:Type II toxin-antitoxin system HigB family toxin n=2 Tax=Limnovirga soli TaxID=2656915 RepID=A0A8J8F9P9_9BACT|nr:type II toxin-antitoxin system HigB family toxin [Limnovirga soli]
MKIHLIRKESIEDFVKQHARSRVTFQGWLAKLKYADWDLPSDMMATFGSADLLGNNSNRVVFNIAGNTYRMICKYAFGDKQVHLFVCWIGTHAAYDKLCNLTEQYTESDY